MISISSSSDREGDVQLEEEAVELRLGQRVGALHLDRVLRGEHEERLGERVLLLGDGDAVLLHRLEQRALRLGRGAVDLVGQHQVARRSGPAGSGSAARPPSSTMMLVPTMSAGIRSGVNWMRLKPRSSASASVRTSIVLPRPGTPSSSAWPPASRLISVWRTSSCWPTMKRPTSVSIAVASSAKRSGSMRLGAAWSVLCSVMGPSLSPRSVRAA